MNEALEISPNVTDVLREIANIGIGRAACALSELSGREVQIALPDVELICGHQIDPLDDLNNRITLRISQKFEGPLSGHALLALNQEGASRLARMLLGVEMDSDAFHENEQTALLELGNIILGSVTGHLVNHLDVEVGYELPLLQLRGVAGFIDLISDLVTDPNAGILLMRATLSIRDENVSGYCILIFQDTHFRKLIEMLEKMVSSW